MTWTPGGLRHFTRSEFRHPELVDPRLLELIDEARDRAGMPCFVTDDVRFHDDMARIYGPDESEWEDSPHQVRDDGFGHAVDLKPQPYKPDSRFRLIHAAIGLYLDGEWPRLGLGIYNGHIHLDNDPVLTRPWIWVGTSR